MQLWSCRTGKSSRRKLVHCRNIVTFGHTLSLLRSWAADVLSTQGGITLIKKMIFDEVIYIQNRRLLIKIFEEGNYSYGHFYMLMIEVSCFEENCHNISARFRVSLKGHKTNTRQTDVLNETHTRVPAAWSQCSQKRKIQPDSFLGSRM